MSIEWGGDLLSGNVPRFFGRSARSVVLISVFNKKAVNTGRLLGGVTVLGDWVALNDVDLNRQDVEATHTCKFHSITGHEGPDGKYCFVNLGAGWGADGQRHFPAALPPGKRPGTHCKHVRVQVEMWTTAVLRITNRAVSDMKSYEKRWMFVRWCPGNKVWLHQLFGFNFSPSRFRQLHSMFEVLGHFKVSVKFRLHTRRKSSTRKCVLATDVNHLGLVNMSSF